MTSLLGQVSSPVTLWEAYKSVLRGHIIQLAARRKKERLQKQHQLEARLEPVLEQFKQNPSPPNRKLLDQAHTELDLCLTDSAEQTLWWTLQKWYAKANKPDTMLARRLRTFALKHSPITLSTRHNVLTSNPVRVLEEFRHHLTSLYASSAQTNDQAIAHFLGNLSLQKLSRPIENL